MANNGTQYLPGGGAGKVPQFFGVYIGYVSINIDPLGQGRCRLRVPQVLGTSASGFAAPLIAGTPVPAIGAAVSVMFLGGDPTQPTWIGSVGAFAPLADPTFTGPITSTGGTAADPTLITTDVWHSITLPTTGTWAGTIRMMMLPFGFACLDVDCTFSPTTSGVTYNAGSVLSTYVPASLPRQWPVIVNQAYTLTANGVPRVAISAGPIVQFDMPGFDSAGTGCLVQATAVYPLT